MLWQTRSRSLSLVEALQRVGTIMNVKQLLPLLGQGLEQRRKNAAGPRSYESAQGRRSKQGQGQRQHTDKDGDGGGP